MQDRMRSQRCAMTMNGFVVQKLATSETNIITSAFRELASGLQFPEGPITMPDGSVILVEIRRHPLHAWTAGRVRMAATGAALKYLNRP